MYIGHCHDNLSVGGVDWGSVGASSPDSVLPSIGLNEEQLITLPTRELNKTLKVLRTFQESSTP